MTRIIFVKRFCIASCAFASITVPLHSQTFTVCGVAGSTPLCINQVNAGDTQVTGHAPNGKVDIKIGTVIVGKSIKVKKGKFTFPSDDSQYQLPPLQPDDLVSVRMASPTSVAFPDGIAVAGAGNCDRGSPPPCLNQPIEGSAIVSGEAASANYAIDVLGKSKTPAPVKPDATGTGFTAPVATLSRYDQVELLQYPGGAIVAGPFKVEAKTAPTCDAKTKVPCINPVQAGQSEISGFATNPSAKLTIDVNGKPLGQQPTIGSDGAFSVSTSTPTAGEKIAVAETTPLTLNVTVPVAPAVPPCAAGTKKGPCVGPLEVGDSSITGFLTSPSSQVMLTVNKQTKVQPTPGADGSFNVAVAPLTKGEPITLTETPPDASPPASTTVGAPASSGATSSLYTLGLVGVNATGTSASGPSQQYFVSFDTIAPVRLFGNACGPKDKPTYPLQQRCWVWLNPLISSAPTPANTTLSSFSSPTTLASGIGSQTIGEITQTFDFQGGFEYALGEPYNGTQFGWNNSWARSTISIVVAGGGSTPLNSVSNASEYTLNANLGAQFQQNPAFAKAYPVLAQALCNTTYGFSASPPCTLPLSTASPTYTNVAFVLPNRSRFYRDYFAAFRLRTYYFTGACKDSQRQQQDETSSNACKIDNTYPGTFDVRFGQDETVTGGYLRSVVMTLTGTYPFPGTGGTIRIFGSTYLRLHHNQNVPSLALLATSPAVPVTNASVVIQPINASDQDYYRLGVGVDLVPLISKWIGKGSSASATQPSSQ